MKRLKRTLFIMPKHVLRFVTLLMITKRLFLTLCHAVLAYYDKTCFVYCHDK